MPRHVAHPRHPLTGKQFRVSARSAAELERLLGHLKNLREELRMGMVTEAEVDRKLRRVRYGPVRLERVLESYARREDLSPDTVKAARTAMRGPLRELAALDIEALEVPVVSRVFERVASKHAKGSVARIWRVLRALLLHAAERGWIGRLPWGAWRPRAGRGQPGRALREACRSDAERAQLVAAAVELDDEDLAGKRPYRALAAKIAAAAHLGLRQGEIAGLRVYDLYPARFVVGIRRQWDGDPLKGAIRGSDLAAPKELFAILVRHVAHAGLARNVKPTETGRPLFPRPGGGHYERGSKPLPLEALREVVRRAGLPSPERWTAHSLRDSFATIEAQRTPGDFAAIAKRTRHTTIASLLRYLRSFERELAQGELRELPERVTH